MTNQNRPYVLWRRVSTKQQGESGLGLDAQQTIAEYFMHGKPVKVYTDVYSGTKLGECPDLKNAIRYCKQHGYLLVIAKTDRFRNVQEALAILDEMGEGNLCFCDLPTTDRTVLTIVWAIWERQALMGRINTKRALTELKKQGVKLGRPAIGTDIHGKPIYDMTAMQEASARARADDAIRWRDKSEAVAFARRKRAEGCMLQQIVDELGHMFDDYAERHPGEPNIYATRGGCKPVCGTISKWLRESNLLAV